MIDLGLKRNEERFQNVEKELLSLFFASSTSISSKKFRFAKVDSNFVDFLPYLKDGAVKLYLYYVVAARSNTGESWHSIDTISSKLGVTERSISNWNNQLEDLGLIYRTSNGKKSKATFILPLTSFAVKMDVSQIEQMLNDIDLYNASIHSKIFGKYQSLTKLYIKNETTKVITEVLCVHLKKANIADGTVLNVVNFYIYNICTMVNEGVIKQLSLYNGDEKVAIIRGEESITLGKKIFDSCKCFLINVQTKIDDATIFEIMRQLTDNVDLSLLKQIRI